MFGTAVIVFREVLEAALIISLMLVATRGMVGRGRWVWTGMASGLGGALLLALLAERISNAIAGTGQELINALILFTAVAMLTWHLVWMRKHAAQLSQQIRRVGAAVMAGEQAPTALAIIIGLAVLREGSELVLFLYGIAASGSGASTLLFGSLIGLAAGAFIGVVLYFGLLRIPVHYLFRVTGWLILLLAAGLAAQAMGYLVQADLLPALGDRIWDSSQFLSQQSVLGQLLHITLGYLDRPMGIQLLAYVSTLLGISLLTHFVNGGETHLTPTKAVATVLVLYIALLFIPGESHASYSFFTAKIANKGTAQGR
jgi:high-affinity iron transporter